VTAEREPPESADLRRRREELAAALCPLASGAAEAGMLAAFLRDYSPLEGALCRRSSSGRLADELAPPKAALTGPEAGLVGERLRAEVAALERLQSGESEATAEWGPGFREIFCAVRVRGAIRHCLTFGPVLCGAEGASLLERRGKTAPDGPGVVPATEQEWEWHCEVSRRTAKMLEYLLLQDVRAREALREISKSARVRAMGELANGVAHHFNNILSVVLGYTTFVLNREELPAEVAGPLEKVIDAAMRGRRLTTELLKFASAGAEEEAPVHVQDVFGTVLSLLEAQVGGRVKIETSYGAQRDTVRAQVGVIHKLVYNLLAAAFDSMPDGGRLAVETSNVSMDTEYGMQTFLKVVVTDTGGFVPRRSAEAVDLLEGSSATFLLSDVYGIVGTLEGSISVSSRPGRETRVEILLPVTGEGAEAARPSASPPSPQRRTVWVIDDDPRFREMCRVVLGEAGYKVREFSDGRSALKEIESGAAGDVLLLDYSMPEINGLEFCQRLDAMRVRTPVVIVSGLGVETEGIRDLLGRRSTYYLQKPFASKELLDTLSVALGETLMDVSPS